MTSTTLPWERAKSALMTTKRRPSAGFSARIRSTWGSGPKMGNFLPVDSNLAFGRDAHRNVWLTAGLGCGGLWQVDIERLRPGKHLGWR
jgi:hypothetical protein